MCNPFFNHALLIKGDLLGVVVTTISDSLTNSSIEEDFFISRPKY